ncbi:1, 4-beta cellobiohydrolase [Microbacterium sp. C448]|uniref:glycoside hydrolase family 6 protein n=1 Tax=Microbacterium sp. C448 TaxID=1177594 RepID=UPI0003DE35D3|nr:glycoside hydrolase family 6 protein [Microbacterium sp. C448]CDJ99611.1 1, 4-beta cellobiohydrolase [Microbacterium sp. C448]
MKSSRRRRSIVVTLVVVLVLVIAGGAVWALLRGGDVAAEEEEHIRVAVFTDTEAAREAANAPEDSPEQAAAAYLAAQPTAFWLVPERDPIGEVGARVTSLAQEASDQGATSTIVVYGLPGRDCGNFSAGGLSEADYATWTAEIGAAVRASGIETIIMLEPDSIALAQECGNLAERAPQLQGAVTNLSADNADIYIDGGHSTWHSPDVMAGFIREMGIIDQVRGFATNVSNYNTDADEVTYARQLSGLLGGANAVIDSARNGVGSTGEWCNPPDRRVGSAPGTVHDDVVDTNLWIKVPGESDGTCNGGPAAGAWWPQSAIVLTTDVVVVENDDE